MSQTVLHSFTGSGLDGSTPYDVVIYENGILYGTTYNGGSNNKGTIYSYDLTTNTFTTLYSFIGTDSQAPFASVIYESGILYGTTSGGFGNRGTIYSYNLSTSTLTTLHTFTGPPTGGTNSFASVIYESGILYGTTYTGGSSNRGILFSYDLTSSTFSILHSFTGTGTDGSQPHASVLYQGGILYGTTSYGGTTNSGTLYSYNLTTNTYATLYSMNGYPRAGVIYESGILYGTTYGGGTSNFGSLFSYNLASNTFSNFYSFTGTSNGGITSRVFYVNGLLYGITRYGGSINNNGTIFSYNLSSNTLTTLYTFNGTDGSAANDVIYENGVLYGTTAVGGSSNKGIICSFTISPETPTSNICFPAKTPIQTDQGKIYIDELDKQTIQGKTFIVTKTVSTEDYLICFEKHALGFNYPNQRTIMSPEHHLLFRRQFVKAKDLLYLKSVNKVHYDGEILYNILFKTYRTVIVNNLVCESLHPKSRVALLYQDEPIEATPTMFRPLHQMNFESVHKK